MYGWCDRPRPRQVRWMSRWDFTPRAAIPNSLSAGLTFGATSGSMGSGVRVGEAEH